MYISFLISLAAFTAIYFVLLYSTRLILKDLSEKRYKQIREKLIKFIQENYPESLPRTRVEFPENK